jgi:hypothetical protein
MKPKAWSYSALNKFLNCPMQYYEVSVTKRFADDTTEENLWGARVHDEIDKLICLGRYDMAGAKDLTPAMQQHVARVLEPMTQYGLLMSELKIGLNRRLQPCDWFDNKNIWLRAILDILHVHNEVATVCDWKTGKVRADMKQMKLFALVTFWTRPDIEVVNTRLEWLKYNDCTEVDFDRDDVPMLEASFTGDITRFRQAFVEERFPAKPSGLCKKYCPVLSCEHNGRV